LLNAGAYSISPNGEAREPKMVDITKCKDSACQKRMRCYRFIAEPDEGEWQTCFLTSPRVGSSCEYFWLVDIPGSDDQKDE